MNGFQGGFHVDRKLRRKPLSTSPAETAETVWKPQGNCEETVRYRSKRAKRKPPNTVSIDTVSVSLRVRLLPDSKKIGDLMTKNQHSETLATKQVCE